MEQEEEKREGEGEPGDQPGAEVGEKTGAGREEVEEDVEEEAAASATVPEDRPYRCEICGRSFKLPVHLGRHMTTIHKDKSAEEKKVESKAKVRAESKAAKKEASGRKTRYLAKTVPCLICGKRLAPQGMSNHMKMHKREGKGPDLKTLVTEAVSEGVEAAKAQTELILEKISGIVDEFSKEDERILQATETELILEKISGIVDEFSKNDQRLLQALEKNGWKVKVKEAEVIILVKVST